MHISGPSHKGQLGQPTRNQPRQLENSRTRSQAESVQLTHCAIALNSHPDFSVASRRPSPPIYTPGRCPAPLLPLLAPPPENLEPRSTELLHHQVRKEEDNRSTGAEGRVVGHRRCTRPRQQLKFTDWTRRLRLTR
jgi:hypothetical protein